MTAVTLGSNISALQTQRRLGDASQATSKLFVRLSSGLRINRASDDASGLAISSDLSMQARVYGQAVRNANDGVSLLAIADSALNELSNIVTRMRELAEQAANGTVSEKQRRPLDAEAQSLAKEYLRISRTTTFNGINLFDGSLANGLKVQLGFGSSGSILGTLGGAKADGSFAAPVSYSFAGGGTDQLAVGDIDGDGIMDMINVSSYSTVHVELGNGDGTFKTSVGYNVAGGAFGSADLSDINGDGSLDLLLGNFGSLEILLNNGNGTFKAYSSFATPGIGIRGTAVSDLNGDGRSDLVFSTSSGVQVRLGNGNGTFTAGISYDSGTDYRSMRLIDLNSDGANDMVLALSGGGINVRLGQGNGTFGSVTNYSGSTSSSHDVETGDINGDGYADLVIGGTVSSDAGVEVMLGNSNGTFKTGVTYAVTSGGGYIAALRIADLNGDGLLDFAAAGQEAGLNKSGWIMMGNGDGTFGQLSGYTPFSGVDCAANDLELKDLNGDGVLDFILNAEEDTETQTWVYLGNSVSGINTLVPVSLKTRADALQSMGILDRTLKNLSLQRGRIGAFDSRLSSALSNLGTVRENYLAAASQIQDTDVAQDSAEFARLQILQQGAVAVLGQANQQPALVLKLLQEI